MAPWPGDLQILGSLPPLLPGRLPTPGPHAGNCAAAGGAAGDVQAAGNQGDVTISWHFHGEDQWILMDFGDFPISDVSDLRFFCGVIPIVQTVLFGPDFHPVG